MRVIKEETTASGKLHITLEYDIHELLAESDAEKDIERIIEFLKSNQDSTRYDIANGLDMVEDEVLFLIRRSRKNKRTAGLIHCEGKGEKGNPYRYFTADYFLPVEPSLIQTIAEDGEDRMIEI